MYSISKIKNNRGFTLMELIVSIAIMSMLISIFLTNYSGGSRGTELNMAAQKMVTDIRLAQNNTLGSVKYNNQVPQGGWGFYIYTGGSGNDTRYNIFADVDGDGEYDAGTEGDTDYGAREILLPNGINIEGISTQKDGNGNNLHITFMPPDPITNIYNKTTSNTSTNAVFSLKEKWHNTTKDVYINYFGLIEVVD